MRRLRMLAIGVIILMLWTGCGGTATTTYTPAPTFEPGSQYILERVGGEDGVLCAVQKDEGDMQPQSCNWAAYNIEHGIYPPTAAPVPTVTP